MSVQQVKDADILDGWEEIGAKRTLNIQRPTKKLPHAKEAIFSKNELERTHHIIYSSVMPRIGLFAPKHMNSYAISTARHSDLNTPWK